MKLFALILLSCGVMFAQNAKPCQNVQNTATSGQVLSAANNGSTPPCRWVNNGGGGGSGTVTSVTLQGTANQITVTGTCTGTVTITCTFSIPSDFRLPGTINKITLTQPATGSTLTLVDGKTFTVSKTLTLDGTDGMTITFPAPVSVTDGHCAKLTKSGSVIGIADAGADCGAGAGDVVGPGSATDTAIALYDGTTGKLIKNSVVTVDTSGNASTPGTLSTGVGSGNAGAHDFSAGTSTAIGANSFGWGAPTTMTTSQRLESPNAVTVAHSLMVIGAPTSNKSTWAYKAVPDCQDSAGNHLNFTQSTDVFSCGTTSGAPTGSAGGDLSGTYPNPTVAKVNGIAYSATAAAHTVQVTTTANTTATAKVMPDCTDTGGNHINFTQSTDAFSCGTSGAGGSYVLVEQHTASNSASLNFTTGITSTYDTYAIEYFDLVNATNNQPLLLEVSTDGGMNWQATNYSYENFDFRATASGVGGGTSLTGIRVADTQSNATSNVTLSGDGTLNVSTGSTFTKVRFNSQFIDGTSRISGLFFGRWESTTAVNAIQFKYASGNITAGTIRLYGIAK